MISQTTSTIAAINDQFRKKGNDPLGQYVLTPQVAAMPSKDLSSLKEQP